MTDQKRRVELDYTNWRGERRIRRVVPNGCMTFESNAWHPEPQWLMWATDEKGEDLKGYAVAGIHSCKPVVEKSAEENQWLLHCRHGQSCYRHGVCLFGCPLKGHPKLHQWMADEAGKSVERL